MGLSFSILFALILCCFLIYMLLMVLVLQGKKNPGTDRESVLTFLDQVKKAKEMMIDRFHIKYSFFFGICK